MGYVLLLIIATTMLVICVISAHKCSQDAVAYPEQSGAHLASGVVFVLLALVAAFLVDDLASAIFHSRG